ncbi:MAG: RICIN domain-containing protein [Acidobacteria bacterium]|nr:RICIN domain-containing protein [Acidobacteriota bacterium]MBI3471404.1 RICIN domain-containing protein [Candidatus Solibacter usitatus]
MIIALSLPLAAGAQGGFEGPGRYEIANIQSNKVIDLDRNDQTTVIQFSSRGTDNQTWNVEQAEGGYYYLRNVMNGNALEAVGNRNSTPLRGTRFHGGASQQWRIERARDGNALIVSRLGKSLDIPDGTSREGVKIQIYDANGEENQRFVFRRVGRGSAVGRDRDRFDRDRFGRPPSAPPDRFGRYYDERDRMWKLEGDGICFYQQTEYRGRALCSRAGEDRTAMDRDWDSAAASVKFFGRARYVEVFEEENFRGRSSRISRDEADLRRAARIGSFRVY